VELNELEPGLWRWTAIHPEATQDPQPGSPADWPAEVGSVAYAIDDTLVLIDPLVPDELWPRLDELAQGRRKVIALTTLGFHGRSRKEVVQRYDASTSRARRNLPSNVIPIPIRRAGETMFWLPDVRTLVPGDRLLGDDNGGLRVCPDSWLRYLSSGLTGAELRVTLQSLLDLPVERVLTSHGEPVLTRGREALAAALG
jgi:glyoxylase-like metal-dependent hydrolase (beta-lactamase superfamily II)